MPGAIYMIAAHCDTKLTKGSFAAVWVCVCERYVASNTVAIAIAATIIYSVVMCIKRMY